MLTFQALALRQCFALTKAIARNVSLSSWTLPSAEEIFWSQNSFCLFIMCTPFQKNNGRYPIHVPSATDKNYTQIPR